MDNRGRFWPDYIYSSHKSNIRDMELKYNKQTVLKVDAFDLETFINETYGLGDNQFSFQATEEIGNGEEKEISVYKKELDDYDKNKLEEFKFKGHISYGTKLILTDLCNRDLIPYGNYLISLFY